MQLRIGTRKSPLALVQAEEVRARLMAAWPGLQAELVPMQTSGDTFMNQSLTDIGGKGLFTKEIEEALLAREVDIAVHSMKDMPTALPPGLIIGAMLPREDARDMLVGPKLSSLADLPRGAVVGTSSLRRMAQIRLVRPDVKVVPLRGNVETRIKKLEQGDMQATLLAVAGIKRLGLKNVPGAVLSAEEFLPAVAQGAIGIECREDNAKIRELLGPLSHAPTEAAVACERSFLAVLDGSCRTPIAGYASIISPSPCGRGQGEGGSLESRYPPTLTLPHKGGGDIWLRGLIVRPDGSAHHAIEMRGADAQALGEAAGKALSAKAGKGFLN